MNRNFLSWTLGCGQLPGPNADAGCLSLGNWAMFAFIHLEDCAALLSLDGPVREKLQSYQELSRASFLRGTFPG